MWIVVQRRPWGLKQALFAEHVLICERWLEVFASSHVLVVAIDLIYKGRWNCNTSLICWTWTDKLLVFTVRISCLLTRNRIFVIGVLWIVSLLFALLKFWKRYKFHRCYLLFLPMADMCCTWIIHSTRNIFEISCVTLSWSMIILMGEIHLVDRLVRFGKFVWSIFSLLRKMQPLLGLGIGILVREKAFANLWLFYLTVLTHTTLNRFQVRELLRGKTSIEFFHACSLLHDCLLFVALRLNLSLWVFHHVIHRLLNAKMLVLNRHTVLIFCQQALLVWYLHFTQWIAFNSELRAQIIRYNHLNILVALELVLLHKVVLIDWHTDSTWLLWSSVLVASRVLLLKLVYLAWVLLKGNAITLDDLTSTGTLTLMIVMMESSCETCILALWQWLDMIMDLYAILTSLIDRSCKYRSLFNSSMWIMPLGCYCTSLKSK